MYVSECQDYSCNCPLQLVSGIRRELHGKMEKEVQTLQHTLDRETDVTHFRELDELTLRHKLASLSFTANIH